MSERLTSGDASLDAVLGGGIPPGSLIVVAGPPGSGKTILAQQLCFANATRERKALYYTTWSEPHDKLVRHLEPFAFFDADALGERVEFVHLADLMSDSAGGLAAVSDEILRRAFETKPAVIVIDSSKALHDVAQPEGFRRAVYDLASRVAFSNAVLLFVGEYTPAETREAPEFAVADGIVQLENESSGPIDRRWLRVLKMRGTEVSSGHHSFRIGASGFQVFQRLESTLPREVPTLTGRAAFGVDGLDAAIGGGIPVGDSVLIAGPSGVGKTLLALQFANAGLTEGERCLYVSFQEPAARLREKAASAGIDWSGGAGDRLTIRDVAPVELDLDEVGALLQRELAAGDVKRVVIDSIDELGFAARDTSRLPGYLWGIAGFVRAAGGTSIFTTELAALGSGRGLDDLSFIFYDVLLLRYIEVESQIRRGLSVLKMRQSEHTKRLHEFTIGDGGIEFGEQFDGVTGLLGWTALSGG